MKALPYSAPLLLLWACGSVGGTDATPAAEGPRPNVVLIVVDDQGYADFDPFAWHDPTISTPNMARLAAAGRVYTEAYVTAPVCSPSRAGLLTGKNQFRWDGPASWGPGLPEEVRTVAEYLRDAGYVTGRVGKSDLGRNFHKHDAREYPLRHGYDEFLGFSAHAHDYWLHSEEIRARTPDPYNTSALLGPLMHDEGERGYDEGYLTDILTDEAIEFVGRHRDTSFFLTLAYNAVHHLIHEAPEAYLEAEGVAAIPNYDPDSLLAFGKHPEGSYSAYYDKYSRLGAIGQADMRKYYRANLASLDDNLGRFLDGLDAAGVTGNTLIVYVSDNGGSPLTGANNAPLTGGKYALWEGGIRVPLAVVWPGRITPGTQETGYVSAADLLPTLAAAADVTLDDPTLDGVSLLEPPSDERLLVWKWQKTWAVRRGDWKLTNADENHWKSEPSAQYIAPVTDDLSLKLFNLADDRGEREELSARHPEKVAELRAAYEAWCDAQLGRY